MRTIHYPVLIHKRFLGIPYTAVKWRTARVDEAAYRRMKGRRFSLEALWTSTFEGSSPNAMEMGLRLAFPTLTGM